MSNDEKATPPEKEGPAPSKGGRRAMPGEAASSHRKPIDRLQPFTTKDTLTKWSPR